MAGSDDDRDGLLSDVEVESRSYVCNGVDGQIGAAGADGTQGARGDQGEPGEKGERGDQGEPGEPGQKGEPGEKGEPGDAGMQGATTLIRSEDEPAGEHCTYGGLKVTAGVDRDADAVLDDAEVEDIEYLCRNSPENVIGFRLLSRYSAPTGPAAEIVAASPDGKTLVFTNGVENTVDFVSIADAQHPMLTARVDVRDTVSHAGAGSVTSVAVTPNGKLAVAAVLDASAPASANPGSLVFMTMDSPSHDIVGKVTLGVGPDSLKITPDGLRAVVAIEDEAAEGNRPGSVQIVTLDYSDPSRSLVTTVAMLPDVGNARSDAQPEFVDITHDGTRAVVSLQENNALAVIDLLTNQVVDYLDANVVTRKADTAADGEIAFDDAFSGRREPDSVCLLSDDLHFVTANEGDTDPANGERSGGRGFSIFDLTGKLVYEDGGALERLAQSLGQYPDSRSGARGIEVEGCAVARFGAREFAFLLGERNSSISVVDVSKPEAPDVVQMLPAPFRPEGAVAIPARGLVVVAGEGPNGGAANDAFLGGGLWIYQAVSSVEDVQRFPSNVLQAYSYELPFGAISSATWNGVAGELIATPDVAFSRQRVWTFVEDGSRMRLAQELLLGDADGQPLSGYDPEGLAMNPEGGYVLASEGTAGNGNSPHNACSTGAGASEKQRNRLLFVNAQGRLDRSYGGGTGIVDLPCAAEGEANGLDWSKLTANGFEGVAVVDSKPGAPGGLRVYTVIQRPLAGGVDPPGLTRIGEYLVDEQHWNFYFYPLEPDLAGARNAIVLSEIAHLGGDEFAILERDQRRTGSSSIKRIYRIKLATGTANVSADPVAKVLAVDLLATPFRFDFEKVESLALTPHGSYVINDNDGGDEGVFFYRLALTAADGLDWTAFEPEDDAGATLVDGGAESSSDAGTPPDAAVLAGSVVINEVLSNPNPDQVADESRQRTCRPLGLDPHRQ